MPRILLKNATLLAGEGFTEQSSDLAIRDGLISSIEAEIQTEPSDEVVDLSGCFVMPGLMDAHCHLIYYQVSDPYDIEL